MVALPEAHVFIEEREHYLYLQYVGGFRMDNAERPLEQAAAIIRQPGKQWRIITDFRDASIQERGVDAILSDYAKGNKPFVERSAVLGIAGGAKKFFFSLVLRLSGRNLRLFDTLEAAEAWIQK